MAGTSASLNGLQQLNDVTAEARSLWKGEYLYLNGLQKLDETTAKALAQYKGRIYTTTKIKKFK